jgi:hypothetical protein
MKPYVTQCFLARAMRGVSGVGPDCLLTTIAECGSPAH